MQSTSIFPVASDRTLATWLRCSEVAQVMASSRWWWFTEDIAEAMTKRVGPMHKRTVLRYLHTLHEAGVIEGEGVEIRPGYRTYRWRFAGWPPPIH